MLSVKFLFLPTEAILWFHTYRQSTFAFNFNFCNSLVTLFECVCYGCHNKKRLFPYKALSDWLYNRNGKCLIFVFKWLLFITKPNLCPNSTLHLDSNVSVRPTFINKWILPPWLKNKKQLDVTYYFIVLPIGLTCFGHYYAHHQELATIMLITTLVVSFLVCCMLEVRCG